jgi:signal transduction histidine kinase
MKELPKRLFSAIKGRESHYVDPKEFKKILFQATILPIALSLFLSALFIQQVYSVLEENSKVRNSDNIINHAAEALKIVIDSETGFRGFIITNNPEYVEPWANGTKSFYKVTDDLIVLLKNDPAQAQEIQSIRTLYAAWKENAEGAVEYRKKYKRTSPNNVIKERKSIMDTIRFKFDEFNRRQTELRNSSWQNAEETSRQAIVIIITLGIFLGVSLAVMSLLQLRRLSRNYTTAYTSLSEATDHLEEVVAQRTHELVLVNKELEAFSYSVSHDLRSPLRGIDGFSQMLVEEYSDKLDKEAIKYLGFIRAGVQKMGMLIDDLINLSRLTRAEFKKSEVDISVISADIIKELKDQSPERKLEFVNFSPQKIQADPGLLRAALQNLLLNAWKYSRYEEISRIELGQILKDNKLTYFVKDNGVGFDMRYYDKLFQPFQRLHPNDKFDGTGIGLATVARIIRRHNGTIWGESEVGIGTIFYFTLGS